MRQVSAWAVLERARAAICAASLTFGLGAGLGVRKTFLGAFADPGVAKRAAATSAAQRKRGAWLNHRGFSPCGSSVLTAKNLRVAMSYSLTLSQPQLVVVRHGVLFCLPGDL